MNKEKKLNIQTLLRKIDSSTRKHMMSRENLSHMPSERDALRHARSQGRLDFLFKDKVLSTRFQTETEKAEQMVDVLFELNKEFKVPIFQLSQAPKQNVQMKNTNLSMGMEKGSSVISEKARWACSLNSDNSNHDNTPNDLIIAEVYKTTMSAKGQRKIIFEKTTGRIVEAEILDA